MACSNTKISYSSLNSPTSIRIFLPGIPILPRLDNYRLSTRILSPASGSGRGQADLASSAAAGAPPGIFLPLLRGPGGRLVIQRNAAGLAGLQPLDQHRVRDLEFAETEPQHMRQLVDQ